MGNSNYDIRNKIFTYVKHSADITDQIKEIYESSLIFIGDEQQIYVPIIDTYVGVGKSKYNELANSLVWIPSEGSYSITTKYGNNRSLGTYSISSGRNTVAIGDVSFASGINTIASGEGSHTEGTGTITYASYSHAEGLYTYTYNNAEHAEGKYNKSNNNTISSIGIGEDEQHRKNAFEVLYNGNAYLYGVGNYTGDNLSSSKSLQEVINRPITQNGVVNNSGLHVINNISINSYGDLSYTYHNLSGSDSGNFLTGYTQSADGKISVSKGTFTTSGHNKTSEQSYVVTYTYIDSTGKIHYDYRDLSGSDSGNFLTGYTQTKDGKISISKGTFTYEGTDKGNTAQSHVITDINISSTGKISYNYRNLSGNDSGNFLTGFSQTNDGKVTVSKGTFTNTNIDEGIHNLATYISTNPHKVVTYTYIDSTGKVHSTYDNIYVDPQNDFKYHDLVITQLPKQGDNDFVYALIGVSTTNGNATSHTIAYQVSYLPTKKYVDEQFKANDALRYCGTLSPSTEPNGTFTFNHDNPYPGHSNPDYDAGAVYKVNGTGYFGTERVSAGDMVISYSDAAIGTSTIGWNVINQNIDLRTASQTKAYNGGSKSSNVLTNAYITNDGTLSYTYYPLSVKNNTDIFSAASVVENNSAQNILRNGGTKGGVKVLTNVSLTQDGLETQISYSYTYIYTEQQHHSGSLENNSGFVYAVSLSSDGTLSGKSKSFTNTSTNSTELKVVTNVNLSSNGGFSYSTKSLAVTSGSSTNDVTSGVIVKLTQAGDGQISYAYRDLSVSSGSAKDNATITNSTKLNVITGITADKSGKISYAYSQLNTTHSTNDANIQSAIELTTSNTNVLTGVSISADGVLSYSVTPISVGDSDHAGTATGLDSVVRSGNDTQGVITRLYVDENNSNILTYTYTNLQVTTAASTGTISGNDFYISYTTSVFSQDATGKITYNVGTAHIDYPFVFGTKTNDGANAKLKGSHSTASGSYSVAEGEYTEATGNYSHAEGYNTTAGGIGSHAEGVEYNEIGTSAMADAAHAEGAGVVVKGQAAHGEGLLNVAGRTQDAAVAALADFPNLSGTTEQKVSKLIGFASHSEGSSTQALGTSSHAEGNSTQALVNATHAEGDSTTASGEAAHSEGYITTASGNQSHAEGYHTQATANQSHAEGYYTQATANQSHAEGKYTKATSENAHAEGNETKAVGNASHSEGYKTTASGNQSHSEGFNTQATANQAHSEGKKTIASAENAHSEGNETKAVGNASHSEGYRTYAYGAMSHIEGTSSTLVSDANAASESVKSIWEENGHNFSLSRGQGSHVEGKNCLATGDWSHAEGVSSSATKIGSHAEGHYTYTSGDYSHAEGTYTITYNEAEHAEGKYNLSTSGLTLHSVGIGTSSAKKNAFEILSDGNAYLINVGNYNGANLTSADPLQTAIFRVKVNNSLTTNKPYYLTGVDTFNTEKQLVGKSTAYITNSYVFVDTLRVSGNTAIGGTLSVSSTTTSGGKLTVSSGGADIIGNTKVTGTFNATGAADFDSTLNVDGNATFNGNITLGNASTDTVTFTSGSVTLSNSMSFTGLSNLWGTIS